MTEAVTEKKPREVKRGVGTVIREQIITGMTNEEAMAAAKAEFPESATTASTVSWYRNDLRKNGNPNNVPTAIEAKAQRTPPASPAASGAETDPLD